MPVEKLSVEQQRWAEDFYRHMSWTFPEDDLVGGDEETDTPDPAVTDFEQIAVLEKKVDELYAQGNLIKFCRALLGGFKKAHKAARQAITSAKSKKTRDIQPFVAEINAGITSLSFYVGEFEDALAVIGDQIPLLQNTHGQLQEHRFQFMELASKHKNYQKKLRNFESADQEVQKHFDQITTHHRASHVDDANKAIASFEKSLLKMKAIVAWLQEAPVIQSAAPELEASLKFGKKVTKARTDLRAFHIRSGSFKDTEELVIFEKLHNRASAYIVEAEKLYAKREYRRAEDMLDNANITMTGLEIAFTRGINTAAQVEGFLQDVKEARKEIEGLDAQKATIQNPEQLRHYEGYSATASTLTIQIERLLTTGRVKDARYMLEDLNATIANMKIALDRLNPPPEKVKPEPTVEAPPREQIIEDEPVQRPRSAKRSKHEEEAARYTAQMGKAKKDIVAMMVLRKSAKYKGELADFLSYKAMADDSIARVEEAIKQDNLAEASARLQDMKTAMFTLDALLKEAKAQAQAVAEGLPPMRPRR
ncbi:MULTISPECIES: hypothetical protein [unclassified Pseudovibrio]|uniref:hypothetical protein n=1 Tax=unclassified Pseudovibrio TaxID=2627060 RepID=UPI0007AEE2A8|nr:MULTISPECIES: hypothetical protein [unclassified Pseudovibrio]KZK98866.1 hypothetical protein PsW74_03455 [Pseudovibrio sp. W74]KZL09359.1 hypothetical protein PsAD14_02420 [Pseudovibrio sp. Ad14]